MSEPRYSIYLEAQRSIPSAPQPKGPHFRPFVLEIVDTQQDDHFYTGFWGPQDLLDNLSQPGSEARLANWIVREATQADDQDMHLIPIRIDNLMELPQQYSGSPAAVFLGNSDNPGQRLFMWNEARSLEDMQRAAEMDERTYRLDQELPTPSPTAKPAPRF